MKTGIWFAFQTNTELRTKAFLCTCMSILGIMCVIRVPGSGVGRTRKWTSNADDTLQTLRLEEAKEEEGKEGQGDVS